MNKLILLLSSVLLSLTAHAVQYGYLSALVDEESDGLVLNTGDVCKILAFSDGNYQSFSIGGFTSVRLYLPNMGASYVSLGGYELFGIMYKSGSTGATMAGGSESSRMIVGPCTIKAINTKDTLYMSYELTRASEVQYKQGNIVSLPSETVGQGTHNIVVEASDDLQTWTPVHSSSIGGNKGFFRTRVAEIVAP